MMCTQIIAYSYDAISRALEHLCSWGGTFIAYSLVSKGNLLVAVDPLRAPSMLRYDVASNKLICCAREYSSYGVFSAAFVEDVYDITTNQGAAGDDEESPTIVVADLDLNVFTATASVAGKAGESELLAPQALVHLGEVVNKFAPGQSTMSSIGEAELTHSFPGSLVPSFSSVASSTVRPAAVPQLIFATSNGSIGMLAALSPEASKVLSDLERNMAKTLPEATGGLKQPQCVQLPVQQGSH
jgi:DNA damage-binding protein 1